MASPSVGTPAAGVERHVYIKLADEHVPRSAEIAAEVAQRLLDVPGVLSAVGQTPADAATAGSWDVCLLIRFPDLDAVDAYVPHPTHQAILDELINPVSTFKKAWNFGPVSG